MKILDLTAGNRAIWYNKKYPDAFYIDKRESVSPDLVWDINEECIDFVCNDFSLVVFDPPHMNCGPNSNMSKVYGYHTAKEIKAFIERASYIAWIHTLPDALMALKWNTHDIKLKTVFSLMPHWEPLFGHLTKDGPRSQTYWVQLRRRP